ncbi:MAG: glycosyltransferase family 4 protein [Methanobacterium sp.]
MGKKVILVRSRAIDSSVFKLADTLFKNGYNIQLLIWDRQNDIDSDEFPYKTHKFNLKAPYDNFIAILYLPYWWIYEFYFLLKNDYDIIHACDLDTLWPAIAAKFIKKSLLFYTIYDFYALSVHNGSFQKIRDLIKSFLSYIEVKGIEFTDTLFLVDELRYNEVKSAKIKNLVYIYNSPPEFYCDNYKAKNKLKIFYGGLITKERGLEHILEAINDMDNIELVIAGSGEKEIVDNIINKKIKYLGWISYKDILINTLESDIIFRFSDPINPRTKTASPNKLFEAMMCAKPIIMNSEMEISKIVKNEKCGIIVHYGDVKAIREAIFQLKDPVLCKDLGLNGRKAYENKYSWDIMEKRIIKAYNGD